jgi:hypothetical protein
VTRTKISLQKLARIDRDLAQITAKQAELLAERSTVMGALADEDANLATGRKNQSPHVAALPTITRADEERAELALKRRRRA